MKKGWIFEDNFWWYYFGKKFPTRTKGILVYCGYCNKEIKVIPSRTTSISNLFFCSRKCSALKFSPFKTKKGELCLSWKGGRIKNKKGYIDIFVSKHPYVRGKKYVLEHRLVIEAYLNSISLDKWIEFGRNGNYPKNVKFLEKIYYVHHINGIKDDNRLENLKIVLSHTHFSEVKCPCCDYKFLIQ